MIRKFLITQTGYSQSIINKVYRMLLSMFTGMRMGEVNAPDVRDIDFKHGVITVNKTVSLNTFKVEYIRKRTKTAGMRRLRVKEDVLAFLRKVIGNRTEGRVFSTRQGGIVSANKVSNAYSRSLKKYASAWISKRRHS